MRLGNRAGDYSSVTVIQFWPVMKAAGYDSDEYAWSASH